MHSIKTQVLLLHSQQSTLDKFSASLGDEYSVHMATSGTEALNTLGLTPIHLMISAQKLPGMSGIEALREARKRSPETLGILIAPEDMSGPELEALVDRDEVFQVIRGVTTPQDMRRIVDDAVLQMKMTTIQSSANDQSAGPRLRSSAATPRKSAPVTATLPGSRPAASPPGRMQPPLRQPLARLVVLSKDPMFLDTIHEAVTGQYMVEHVDNLRAAAGIIVKGQSRVLITDAAVAPREIEAITERLRAKQPLLVTIVAGRRDDGEQLMHLIQSGLVHRFLLKPISPGRAKLAIEAAVRRSAGETDTPSTPEPAAKVGAIASAPPGRGRLEPTLDDFEGAREIVLGEEPVMRAPIRSQHRPAAARRATAGSAPQRLRSWHYGLVAAVILAAAGGWFYLRGDGYEAAPRIKPPSAGTAGKQAPLSVSPPAPAISQTLSDARTAREEGRLLQPGGNGALHLYAAAVAEDPGDRKIAEEAAAAVSEAMQMAHAALETGDIRRAQAAMAVVAASFADETGLPGLESAIADARRQALLAQSAEQLAAGDPDAALASLDEAAALGSVPDPAIVSAREQILAASDTRGRTLLLELGNQRLLQGQLVRPPNDNARYYYRAVLAQDSESIAGRQGMAFLRTALITRIREAVEAGDRRAAESWLYEAALSGVDERRLAQFEQAASELPESSLRAVEDVAVPIEAEATETPIASDPPPAAEPTAADGVDTVEAADERRVAEVQERAEPAAATDTAQAPTTAKDAADQPQVTDTADQPQVTDTADQPEATDTDDQPEATEVTGEIAPSRETEAPETPDPVETSATAGEDAEIEAADIAGEPATTEDAPEVVAGAAAEAPASVQQTEATDTSGPAETDAGIEASAGREEPVEPAPAEMPTLQRLEYVAPEYPRSAAVRREEGWVDLEFSVTADGRTAAIVVVDSDPADVFDRAAIEAVEKWRYERPATVGWPEDERLRLRISFDLDR